MYLVQRFSLSFSHWFFCLSLLFATQKKGAKTTKAKREKIGKKLINFYFYCLVVFSHVHVSFHFFSPLFAVFAVKHNFFFPN